MTQGVDPRSESSPPLPPTLDYPQGDDPLEPHNEPPEPPPQAGWIASTEPTDAELLQAHVDGDAAAFATLVARHQDRLWAVALGVMRNPEDAADALQDAYISAFRRAGSFRGEARVTTWLHRVVVNACLDRLRSLKVRATEMLPEDLDRSPELAAEPTDPVEAEQTGRRSSPHSAGSMPTSGPPWCWSTCRGTRSTRRSILGCAPGTVKSRCARGRARLVPLLAALREPEGNR